MTQQELEAGADGVHEVLVQAGYAQFVNRDQERSLAAHVIRRVDALRPAAKAPAVPAAAPVLKSEAHLDLNRAASLFHKLFHSGKDA